VITATLTLLHWQEDRGWLALVHYAGAPMSAEWVTMDRLEKIPGIDYDVIRPSWWTRDERGRWVEHNHPPA
jgi:hypothetical protein